MRRFFLLVFAATLGAAAYAGQCCCDHTPKCIEWDSTEVDGKTIRYCAEYCH